MKEQFRIEVITAFVIAQALNVSGCASAPTPTLVPTATSTAVPSSTATTVPSAAATVVPSATATIIPSATPTSKPTMTATTLPTYTPTKPAATIAPTVAATQAAGTNPAAVSKDVCLGCHGPFDKVIAASTKYVASSGEKISPHQYIPHDAKGAVNVPECTNCHTAHMLSPLPTAGSIDLSKVGVDWCYLTCHHQNNFTPCIKCHTN